jgi:OFA family oxalate/formate antiporter-like MFS transporter
MVGFGLQMMLAHLVPYMQETYRLSPSAAAAVFSVIGVSSASGRLIMGGVSDYLGARKSLALSVVVEGVAVGLIVLSTRQWMLYPFGILLGFGYGGHAPQFPAIIRELFGMKRMGRNIGLQQIFYGSGALLGPLLAGWMFDRTGSYVLPFAIASGVLMLAGWLSLTLERPADWETAAHDVKE